MQFTIKLRSTLLQWILPCLLLCTGGSYCQMEIDFSWTEKDCPGPDTVNMINKVAWGEEGRAYKTLPSGLVIAPSQIEGAGFGVLSETFIPKYTWLGEYEGELISLEYEDISWYTWTVHRDGESIVYVDGYQLHLSTYHRFINAPNRHRDENVVAQECYGRIYYMTIKDILPGDELLVYYGHSYAKQLNIDINEYFEVSRDLVEGGLDLSNETHRSTVQEAGFDLHELKDVPSSWLSVFLGTSEDVAY